MNEKIDEIMDNFDFDRVHEVMEFLGWSYYGKGLPSMSEIKECAKERLENVIEDNVTMTSSGGFVARREEWEHGQRLSLEFSIASWSVD